MYAAAVERTNEKYTLETDCSREDTPYENTLKRLITNVAGERARARRAEARWF